MSDFSKKVIDEAYAKVIWGEQPGEVINWLVHEKGFTGHQAKELVSDACKDRAAEVRKSGMTLIIRGIIIAGLSAAFLVGLALVINRVFFILLIGVAWGFIEVVRGIPRLISGRSSKGVSDL